MSTRDELAAAIDRALVNDHDAFSEAARELSNNDTGRLSDALIAEGWRKKPSRDEVARAIAWGVDGVDGEQFDDAAVDYRLEMLQGADAVLALMDRGQRMDDYTPTTEQVRTFWASDGKHQPAAKSYGYEESALEFDRWLTAHDRVVAANAWDEAIAAAQSLGDAIGHYQVTLKSPINPYRITEENN